MEVVFNEELFDKLSTADVEKCVKEAESSSLQKLSKLGDFIQQVKNEKFGFKEGPLSFEKDVIFTADVFDKSNVCVFQEGIYDTLKVSDLKELIQNSRPKLLLKLTDLCNFAKDEIRVRSGESFDELTRDVPCEKSDMFQGKWLDQMRCGKFENYQGLLVFRPLKGVIVYHGSDSFRTGDPFEDPIWFGTYENSMQYVEDGYMNLFRIVEPPRLLVLTELENMEYLLSASSPIEKEAISTVTGIEKTNLEKLERQYGCKYENKKRERFSRFSSRTEDMIMARTICSIPGIDGYIQPAIEYCSTGITYRNGNPYPSAKRFNGEVVICNAAKFVERVKNGIPCAKDEGISCDISKQEWRREFNTHSH